eukprot:4399985-Pyramimonas_sp.AAC.1
MGTCVLSSSSMSVCTSLASGPQSLPQLNSWPCLSVLLAIWGYGRRLTQEWFSLLERTCASPVGPLSLAGLSCGLTLRHVCGAPTSGALWRQ